MFTLGRGMFSEYMKKEEYFVLILGIDKAGKTTFADSFKSNFDKTFIRRHPSKITSTVGLNLVKVDCGHVILNLWDVGGERDLRSLWTTYIDESSVIVFVIDGSSEARLTEALESLCDLLKIERVSQLPLLILLNKCEEQTTLAEPSHDRESFLKTELHCSASSSSNANTSNEHSTNNSDADGASEIDAASCLSRSSTTENDDENSAEVRAERIRSRIYECLDGKCEDVAILSVSALENLNVYKSALWILNAIMERKANS